LSILKRFRTLTKELKTEWQRTRIGLFISIVSGAATVQAMIVKSGPFFLGFLSFTALGIAILYTVPEVATRAFVRRILAFLVDFLIFAIGTFSLLSCLIEIEVVSNSAFMAMCIVWGWVALFTICDCYLGGTPGKKAMSLRLKDKSATRRPYFILWCLGRNLVTYVIPITLAGSILSLPTSERTRVSSYWAIAVTILVFTPLSIVFFDGNSVADILCRMEVMPKARRGKSLLVLDWKRWCSLSSVSLLTGVLYGFVMPTMYRPQLADGSLKQPWAGYAVSSSDDIKAAASLRQTLEVGIPAKYVQDVSVLSEIGGLQIPEKLALDESSRPCISSLQTTPHYKTIRVQVSPGIPIGLSALLFSRLMEASAGFTKAPGLVVFDVYKKKSLGVFTLEVNDAYTLCATNAKPDLTAIIGYSHPSSVFSSFNELAWLFLGRLGTYSIFEKCPVFPD
jgi:hypothetical protein